MKGLGFAFLAIVSWAATNILLRGIKDVWPINLAGILSRVVAVAILAIWVLSTGDGWRRLRPRAATKRLLLMGMVAMLIILLWFNAIEWTSATNVALLFRLDLVFVIVIGSLLGVERIGRRQLLLLPVILLGLALFTEIHRFDFGGHLVGDLMVVGAALGYAFNAFVIRDILRTMDVEAVSLYNMSINSLGLLAFALIKDDFAKIPEIGSELTAWVWIAVFGMTSAIALPLYYAALRHMSVWKLRTYMLAAPVLVAAVEWPLWGLRLSVPQCVGAGIIFVGLGVLVRMESVEREISVT